jgi:predicted alpha/beta superfamily hydrolase
MMEGTIQNLNICGYDCSLYLPKGYGLPGMRYPVAYVNGGNDPGGFMCETERRFGEGCTAFVLLNINPRSWDDEFTPWPAPALKRGNKPFGGCAAAYLNSLANTVKPFMDEHYKTRPEPVNTALLGYSLGGLAALYALYTSGAFGRIGSLSGSLWYDGWVEYMQTNLPVNAGARVYLSLGKTEENSRNRRMAGVGDCTREAAEILSGRLAAKENLTFELNRGGHFTEIPQRFTRALLWLMREEK